MDCLINPLCSSAPSPLGSIMFCCVPPHSSTIGANLVYMCGRRFPPSVKRATWVPPDTRVLRCHTILRHYAPRSYYISLQQRCGYPGQCHSLLHQVLAPLPIWGVCATRRLFFLWNLNQFPLFYSPFHKENTKFPKKELGGMVALVRKPLKIQDGVFSTLKIGLVVLLQKRKWRNRFKFHKRTTRYLTPRVYHLMFTLMLNNM